MGRSAVIQSVRWPIPCRELTRAQSGDYEKGKNRSSGPGMAKPTKGRAGGAAPQDSLWMIGQNRGSAGTRLVGRGAQVWSVGLMVRSIRSQRSRTSALVIFAPSGQINPLRLVFVRERSAPSGLLYSKRTAL